MTEETLSLATRLWFAWLCFFRVLFDGTFAARVWSARQPAELPAPPPVASTAPSAAPGPQDAVEALQLLSLLQREGRLVDFLQQDIASFPDADVGAAARVVHDGCRRALRAHATIEPVRSESEGARVVARRRLRARRGEAHRRSVGGEPPYKGVLRHRGWRGNPPRAARRSSAGTTRTSSRRRRSSL